MESTHLYDGKNVKITCVFGGEWAQRIEVLGEKEHGTRELTFSGIINGDLSQGNLPVLEDCKLY
ncbi:MAG: hypothetical protein NTZ13_01560 [Candidatus Parcubacteria bacterium]|nr:hypothetical protein [Candidatus Parcubacteria bacterium]